MAADAADALAAAVCHALRGQVRCLARSWRRVATAADDRISQGSPRAQAAARLAGRRERGGLRARGADVDFLRPAGGRGSRWRCSPIWWCARTRISCSASAPTASGGCSAVCSRCRASVRRSRWEFYRARASRISCESWRPKMTAMLTRIPGIGRKTAERVIIEMRDSVQKLAVSGGGGRAGALGAAPRSSAAERGVRALIALGYKPPEVDAAVEGGGRARAFHHRNHPPRPEVRGKGMRSRMGIEQDRIIAARRRREDEKRRSRRAAEEPRRLRGPAQGEDPNGDLHPGGAHARRGAGSRADLRAARGSARPPWRTSSPTSSR